VNDDLACSQKDLETGGQGSERDVWKERLLHLNLSKNLSCENSLILPDVDEGLSYFGVFILLAN